MNCQKHILIADDEREITKSLMMALSPYLNVDEAHSASEIFSKYQDKKYDAVLLDVEFGYGINGIEAAKILRKMDKDIQIIIMSAVDYSPEVRQKAIDLGATFLEKTINIDSLMKVLEVEADDK